MAGKVYGGRLEGGGYFDNNATTPLFPEVASAMGEAYSLGLCNPSSSHQFGRRARKVLSAAEDSIVRYLGGRANVTDGDRLIFTSGGTEANNLAILGVTALEKKGEGSLKKEIIISSVEHPSVARAAEVMQNRGYVLHRVKTLRNGVVDLAHFEKLISEKTALVSVMYGNNETGVMQPVEEIADSCARHRVLFHTDAVQAMGKVDLSFRGGRFSAMTVTAHKLHGPKGIGALLLRGGGTEGEAAGESVLPDQTSGEHPLAFLQPDPLLFGGVQQLGIRPGTQTPELAHGFATALMTWEENEEKYRQHLMELRELFEERLLRELPNIIVHGGASTSNEEERGNGVRLPHVSNISFPGKNGQELLMALDMVGIACSTGAACSSGSPEPSPVLLAMGIDRETVKSAVRFSFSVFNTVEEVSWATEKIVEIVRR
ncbi:MAG: cysteine desulfurase [Pirellulaceae bacterium]|nr:cysteine desulfurase [Pirellulaceae bacterium]